MKVSSFSLTLLSLIPSVFGGDVISLTPDNFHSVTAGKAVFIKFFAPWCGHCKAMADDYEKLAAEYKSSADKVIAEVDCTDEVAKDLCQEHGVQGFPTLKYGNPSALSDYQGARTFDALNDFVKTELKVSCSPFNLELCNDDEKAQIGKIQNMSDKDLENEIDKVEKLLDEADAELQAGIEKLQQKYEEMMEANDQKLNDLKAEFDYKLKKSVLAMKKKAAGGSGEEL